MTNEQMTALVRNPLDAAKADVAAHVFTNPSSWPAFERELYPDESLTEEERLAISRVVAEHCKDERAEQTKRLQSFIRTRLEWISSDAQDFALAAASRQATAKEEEESNAAKESVTFVFLSDALASAGAPSWRAELTLPPDAQVDDLLTIQLTDSEGIPLSGGLFKISGVALPVSDGKAAIPYGLFLSGLKDARVERVDATGVRTYGTLALF